MDSNRYKVIHGDSFKHGKWTEVYDSNAIILSKYKRGKKEGKAKIIFQGGDYIILHFKNDLRHGMLKHYLKNGWLWYKIRYRNGSSMRMVRHTPIY